MKFTGYATDGYIVGDDVADVENRDLKYILCLRSKYFVLYIGGKLGEARTRIIMEWIDFFKISFWVGLIDFLHF